MSAQGALRGALRKHIANEDLILSRDLLLTKILIKRMLKLESKVAVFGDEFTVT